MKSRQGWFGALAMVVSAVSLGCGAPATSSGILERARISERTVSWSPVDSPRSVSVAVERPRSYLGHSSVSALRGARR
jgi:hypothetical protein